MAFTLTGVRGNNDDDARNPINVISTQVRVAEHATLTK